MKEYKENFWDKHMGDDEGAAQYMEPYGEGPGSDTRKMVGSFINDGESVLDVGCGPGWNYDHFQQYGPRVSKYLGLDYSRRFVRVANKRNPGQYEYGDCRKLTQADNSFDVVLLQDVLEHTNGYEKPITEAIRVAKKRVIIAFWRPLSPNDSEDSFNDDGDDGWGADYSLEKFEEFMDSTGYFWCETETDPGANRWHIFYIIDKEENYEKSR